MGEPKSEPRNLSRREFLKAAGIVTGSALLAACAPSTLAPIQPTREDSLPTQPIPPTQPQQNTEPTADVFQFSRERDPETQIEVIKNTNGTPFTEAEFNQWSAMMKESGEYLTDPTNRTTTFLIGHKAWEKWNNKGILDGEKPLPFLKRHTEKMNWVFREKTRPSSGISSLRLTPIVVLVDEDWISQAQWRKRQSNEGDTFGRWSLDLTYDPKFSKYFHLNTVEGRNYDDGLLHELMHYSFYLMPHLYHFFPKDSPNWKSSLVSNFRIGNPYNLFFWSSGDDLNGLNTGMLENTENNPDNQFLLSEPEELFLKRNLFSYQPPLLYDEYSGSEEFFKEIFTNDLATDYAIKFNGSLNIEDAPILYKSKIKIISNGNNVELVWLFDETSEKTECQVVDGKAIIPKDFVSGLSREVNGKESAIPNAFVIKMGDNFLGFTSYHLAYWHWKEQINRGEQGIGKFGNAYPVEIPITDWNP